MCRFVACIADFRSYGLKIPARLTYLATGETQSHLNYLLAAGLISRHVDGDGVAWFQRC
jgi:hypothetical protein